MAQRFPSKAPVAGVVGSNISQATNVNAILGPTLNLPPSRGFGGTVQGFGATPNFQPPMAADLRAGRLPSGFLPPPAAFNPVRPAVDFGFSNNNWSVPARNYNYSFNDRDGRFSWDYWDGRCRYDQRYVSTLLYDCGWRAVNGYDGFLVSSTYFCYGIGYLDGCIDYGYGRIWVPGYWLPVPVVVSYPTQVWIPPVYDWIWTPIGYERVVVDGGYFAYRDVSGGPITRYTWVPGHWERYFL